MEKSSFESVVASLIRRHGVRSLDKEQAKRARQQGIQAMAAQSPDRPSIPYGSQHDSPPRSAVLAPVLEEPAGAALSEADPGESALPFPLTLPIPPAIQLPATAESRTELKLSRRETSPPPLPSMLSFEELDFLPHLELPAITSIASSRDDSDAKSGVLQPDPAKM